MFWGHREVPGTDVGSESPDLPVKREEQARLGRPSARHDGTAPGGASSVTRTVTPVVTDCRSPGRKVGSFGIIDRSLVATLPSSSPPLVVRGDPYRLRPGLSPLLVSLGTRFWGAVLPGPEGLVIRSDPQRPLPRPEKPKYSRPG